MTTVLLTPADAAARLAVTERYLMENYARLGIPVVRLGHRTLRFRAEDLDRWAAKQAKRRAALSMLTLVSDALPA